MLGAAGSIGFAIVAAFAGIYLGLRSQLRGSIDERERRELIRSAVINGFASIGFVIALIVIARATTGWLPAVLATVIFMGVIFYQSLVVQPRALSRRHALEAARDPIAAARRRRNERIKCWVGVVLGTAGGMFGLIGGLIVSGRL